MMFLIHSLLSQLDDLVIVPLLGWLSYRSLPAPVQHDVVPEADAGENTSRRTVLYMVVLLVAVVLVILLGSGEGNLAPVSPVLSQ